MADEQARREGQEGSRWINKRPTGDEVASWFKDNVAIHEGLDHKDYVSGVTLIQQTEKSKEVVGWRDEAPVIAERQNLVFTPYAKVETRVKYFHDLMAQKEEWLGVIEPAELGKSERSSMPPGFFSIAMKDGKGEEHRFVCCSMKVTVYERESVEWVTERFNTGREQMVIAKRRGKTIIDAPPATKMIAALKRTGYPDEFAMMKAETGAVGRALGLAGMLVIPGTGVATAEDMAEAAALDTAPPPTATGETASVPQEDERSPQEILTDLRQQAAVAVNKLKQSHPEEFKAFQEWAAGRGISRLDEINDERILRGVLTKAERDLAEAAAPSS